MLVKVAVRMTEWSYAARIVQVRKVWRCSGKERGNEPTQLLRPFDRLKPSTNLCQLLVCDVFCLFVLTSTQNRVVVEV
jgi:hypothetical protein